jgi:acetyl-CoA C-acetyltransferase
VACDGAGVVVLASAPAVKKYHWKPRARILGYASVAIHPQWVFAAGISAIQECLKKAHLSIRDIDLFEISEAFAAQAILTKRKLHIPGEKINIFGGDVAFGHPLGAAGTRILITLIHALIDQQKQRGVVCVCLGGGGAVAVAIERC